jgi:hypothetical protein
MSNALPWRDRYFELIDQIVQTTLKGNIRSKEQVYQLLLDGIDTGTGEIFEQCLHDRVTTTQQRLQTETDELKQAKANRSLRAMGTIQSEWQRWQVQNQINAAIDTAMAQIVMVEPAQRLTGLLRAIDPNREPCLSTTQLKQLAKTLQQRATLTADCDLQQDLQQLATGILRGLEAWSRLQDHLVSWVYEPSQMGFGTPQDQPNPWAMWAKHITNPLALELCNTIVENRSVIEFAIETPSLNLGDWVEFALLLHYTQQGMVTWLDQVIYKSGAKTAISTFLMFAIVWAQLARGFESATALNSTNRVRFADGSFQIAVQILRIFTQRSYFPLYSSTFSAFPGSRIRGLVNYLDEPLKRVEGTQEKARILTLIGASERIQGQLEVAKEMHDIAREIAAGAGDRPCEIANLNHLSRTCAAQKNYSEAINHSQRALMLSRQVGDRPGEANALVNLGYSEVFEAHQREQADPDQYELPIGYLQQGLKLAEQLGDRQSQALGYNSLGIAFLILEQFEAAVTCLIDSMRAAQVSGDLYLQGLNLSYLAEAYYRQQLFGKAIYTACAGMYYLDLISSRDWRQPAGLLIVLQGQMGDGFQTELACQRSELIVAIGSDGYDHLPQLLERYRHPDQVDR